jgi:peptidoglycan/LPS O-acetylase OafA/YrhL
VIRVRAEAGARVLILLAIGGMAGAAAFTHVHDLTVAHGQPDWIGWANAVAVELMAIYLGLEIRARLRAGRPVGLVGVLLVAFALLSLAAQVAEAEPSVWGWTVAAVPSLAFLALVKVVLSAAPPTTPQAPVDVPTPTPAPLADTVPEPEARPEPVVYAPVPARAGPSAVLPPLGVVRPDRPRVIGSGLR